MLQIYADPAKTSSNPNGATLQSVLFTNPTSSSDAAGNFDFIPTSTFTFLADTRYWLLVDATAGNYIWQANDPVITPIGIGGIVNNGYLFSGNNGSTYRSTSNLNSFQINATEVTAVPFEFETAAGLVVFGGYFAIKQKFKKKFVKKER